MKNTDYNGWKNRSTWNIALHIDNDEYLYSAAVDYMRRTKIKYPAFKRYYIGFIRAIGMKDEKTPDGIKWLSNRLDYIELNDFMKELGDTQ